MHLTVSPEELPAIGAPLGARFAAAAGFFGAAHAATALPSVAAKVLPMDSANQFVWDTLGSFGHSFFRENDVAMAHGVAGTAVLTPIAADYELSDQAGATGIRAQGLSV
ncbi:hypothetical protein [Nocardia sp. NPDC004722]